MAISKSGATKVSMATALFLAVIKAATGIMTGSLAVFASAVDSLLDILASFINYAAIKMSEEPPDSSHPFGHGKFETLASYLQSLFIMASGVFIIYQAYVKLTSGKITTEVGPGIWVMIISIIATLLLTLFLRKVAKRERSAVLEADALHYAIDLLTNSGVLLSLVIIKFTGWALIDPILSLIIAAYIIKSALKLHLDVTRDLLDEKVPQETMDKVTAILDEYDPYHHDYHRLRSRRAGSTMFVDMHLTLCRRLTLQEAHDIADMIEKRIESEIPGIDVNTHLEPCEHDCPGVEQCQASMIKILPKTTKTT